MKISQGTKTSMGARQALNKTRSTGPLPSPSQSALPNTMVLTEGHRVAAAWQGVGGEGQVCHPQTPRDSQYQNGTNSPRGSVLACCLEVKRRENRQGVNMLAGHEEEGIPGKRAGGQAKSQTHTGEMGPQRREALLYPINQGTSDGFLEACGEASGSKGGTKGLEEGS